MTKKRVDNISRFVLHFSLLASLGMLSTNKAGFPMQTSKKVYLIKRYRFNLKSQSTGAGPCACGLWTVDCGLWCCLWAVWLW